MFKSTISSSNPIVSPSTSSLNNNIDDNENTHSSELTTSSRWYIEHYNLDKTVNIFHDEQESSMDAIGRHENDYLDIELIAHLRREDYFPVSLLDDFADSESDNEETIPNDNHKHNSKENKYPDNYASLLNPMNAMYDDRYALVRHYRQLRKQKYPHLSPLNDHDDEYNTITINDLIDADIRKEEELQAFWDGKASSIHFDTNNNNTRKNTNTIESLLIFQKENNYLSTSNHDNNTTSSEVYISQPSTSKINELLIHKTIPPISNNNDDEEEEDNDYYNLPSPSRYRSPFSSLPQVFSPVTNEPYNNNKIMEESELIIHPLQPISKNLNTLLEQELISSSNPIGLSHSNIPKNDYPNNYYTLTSLKNSYQRDKEKLNSIHTIDHYHNDKLHEISNLPDLSLLNIQNSPILSKTSKLPQQQQQHTIYEDHNNDDIPLKLEHLENKIPNYPSKNNINHTHNIIKSTLTNNQYPITDPIDRSMYNYTTSYTGIHSTYSGMNSKINTHDPVPLSPLFAQQYARIHAQLESLQRSYNK